MAQLERWRAAKVWTSTLTERERIKYRALVTIETTLKLAAQAKKLGRLP
jgi:hypothetical protein